MSRSEDDILHSVHGTHLYSDPQTYSMSHDEICNRSSRGRNILYEDHPRIPSPSHQRRPSRHDTGGSRPKEVAFASPLPTLRTGETQQHPDTSNVFGVWSPWQPLFGSPSVTSFGDDDLEQQGATSEPNFYIQPSVARKRPITSYTSNIQHANARPGTTSGRDVTVQWSARKDQTTTGASIGNLVENPTDASAAWRECANKFQIYDQGMVQGWKEDIDTLLVFAGLFSAVVTAFDIEAYKLLQDDPQDTTVILLTQIAHQLGANISAANIRNSSSDVVFSRRLNTLWFASLVFALAAASMGILVKQWLREFLSSAASSPRERGRIRQFRFEGLLRWKVPQIIALLPVMLQIALAFFLIGLVYLLWSLDDVVAGVITIFVVASLLFLVLTTILPSIDGECPHRSPQALFVYRVRQWFLQKISWVLKQIVQRFSSWSDRPWPLYAPPDMFRGAYRGRYNWITNLVRGKYPTTWREREQQYVDDRKEVLDRRILSGADATFMDDPFLHNVLRYCIDDTDCSVAIDSIRDILNNRANAFLEGEPQWKHSDVVDSGLLTLIHLVSDILVRMDSVDETTILGMIGMLDRLCRAFPFEADHPATADLYRKVYETLASLMYMSDSIRDATFSTMHELFARSHIPVNDIVIESIITYTKHALYNSKIHNAHTACCMALTFAGLVIEESARLRDPITGMLEDVEKHLMSPEFALGGHIPSPSLLMAVLDLADRDRACVSPNLIRLLNRLVSGPDHVQPGSRSSIDVTVASTRAVMHLRERYPGLQQRRKPTRRKVILPDDNLRDINLRLPSDDQPQGSPSKSSPILTRSPRPRE